MNNSPFKIKEQIIIRDFNKDSPYRQRLSRKRNFLNKKIVSGYQNQLNQIRTKSKGNSNQRKVGLKKKCNQNFFINGNKLNPVFRQSLSKNKNCQVSHRNNNLYTESINENQVNDIQQKRLQFRLNNNENFKIQNNFKIKCSKDQKLQQKVSYRNIKIKSKFRIQQDIQTKNDIYKDDSNSYKLFSKNICIEDFYKIWNNFKTAKISLDQSIESLDLKLECNEDQFFTLLVNRNQNCDSLERVMPSGIAIWNYEYKNIRQNQIVIEHLFLLKESPEKILNFLNLISEKIFGEQNFQAHEIVYRIQHQQQGDQLVPPNKEFIKSLKLQQWRWKMVLNLHDKRYTVMYKKNPNKNHSLIYSVNINFFSFMSQLNNMLSFGKQKQRPLQIYETFQNYVQNSIKKHQRNSEFLPIFNQKTIKIEIKNDQDLKNQIQQVNKALCSKDKNLKKLCFQNEDSEKSFLFQFSHILRIHPNTTRNEIINNKPTKISRLPYIYKKQNEQFYFIDTLDPSIKVVVIKYQQKFKTEQIFLDTVKNACKELENVQTRTNQFETVGYLWLPNFKISQDLEKMDIDIETLNFKKSFIEFNQSLPIDKIMISPKPSDKRLKGEFIFGICQANLNLNEF